MTGIHGKGHFLQCIEKKIDKHNKSSLITDRETKFTSSKLHVNRSGLTSVCSDH